MPHLVVEYAAELATPERMESLLQAVHAAALQSGLFPEDHIKVRAYPVQHYLTGGVRSPFIHAQLRIKAGRTAGQRLALSQSVLAALQRLQWPPAVVTVEVVEMEADSYSKHAG